MLERAGAGAGIVHSRAIEFAKKSNVPVHVRSALTDVGGTMITAETEGMEAITVRGVTLKEDLAVVTLAGVPNRAGVAAEVFSEIARHHVLIDDITQTISQEGGVASIGFSTTRADLAEARMACEQVREKLGVGAAEIDEPVSKVSAIGVGMRSHAGVAARMFEALSKAGVNIETISTSEIVISCVVRHEDGPRALQAVHAAFDLDEQNSVANQD
jgi:aspartate kinase